MQLAPTHPVAPLARALASLEAALAVVPLTDVVRDGALHRFEFTVELSWKTIKRALTALGRDVASSSPKPLLRDALQEGFIDDIQAWFRFLSARNLLSHTYNEQQAIELFKTVQQFPPLCRALTEKLQAVNFADHP